MKFVFDGYCGLYCGVYSNLQGTKNGEKENTCHGCKSDRVAE